MGTSTSLMYSPISSDLSRFSMLSLTFCSWPESVWITNHWLCMQPLNPGHPIHEQRQHKINAHGEQAQNGDGNQDHDSRSLQFVPTRPSALAQFLAGFEDIIAHPQKHAFAPQNTEDDG